VPANVFGVAHSRLREDPHRVVVAGHIVQDLARGLVQVDTVPVSVLRELARDRPEMRFGSMSCHRIYNTFPPRCCQHQPTAQLGSACGSGAGDCSKVVKALNVQTRTPGVPLRRGLDSDRGGYQAVLLPWCYPDRREHRRDARSARRSGSIGPFRAHHPRTEWATITSTQSTGLRLYVPSQCQLTPSVGGETSTPPRFRGRLVRSTFRRVEAPSDSFINLLWRHLPIHLEV
jgi:hypothetical protein